MPESALSSYPLRVKRKRSVYVFFEAEVTTEAAGVFPYPLIPCCIGVCILDSLTAFLFVK
jgi:hypothetical protein